MYYIKFDENYNLLISGQESFKHFRKLKTLATINAFFVMLDLGDKILPIMDGHILAVYIPHRLIDIGSDKKFCNKIRSTRYHCHLNNVYCSIISRPPSYPTEFFFYSKGDYCLPTILDEPLLCAIDVCYWQNGIINDNIIAVKQYLDNTDTSIQEEELPNGGVNILLAFPEDYDYKNKDLLRLLGVLGKSCLADYWQFEVIYANFKNWCVVQIYRYYSDLFSKFEYSTCTKWGRTTEAGLTKKCLAQANTISSKNVSIKEN